MTEIFNCKKAPLQDSSNIRAKIKFRDFDFKPECETHSIKNLPVEKIHSGDFSLNRNFITGKQRSNFAYWWNNTFEEY